MAFNIFKKGKEEKKSAEPTAEKREIPAIHKDAKLTLGVLKSPVLSEKASLLAEHNTYIFKVFPGVTKDAVKTAIKETYRVDAVKVNIVNIPAKRIRVGRTIGKRSGFKKAIVTLKEGQKIDSAA